MVIGGYWWFLVGFWLFLGVLGDSRWFLFCLFFFSLWFLVFLGGSWFF